jgi:hypothetical protein
MHASSSLLLLFVVSAAQEAGWFLGAAANPHFVPESLK